MRIIGLIVTTFLIAVIYGLFVTTMDFMGPQYSPVASGHRAANGVYGLFGTAADEIKRNEENPSPRAIPVAYKIARPYAITADLSAIFGGKIELAFNALLHRAQDSTSPAPATTNS